MSLRALARDLYQVLFHPSTYFERNRPESSLALAAGIVFATAIVGTLAIVALGWVLSQQIEATTTVTTMEPWPDSTCESFRQMNNDTNVSTGVPEPCTIDEPRTKQVDLGSKAYSIFAGRAPVVFIGVLLGWPLLAAGLHVVSALANGEGSFTGTLAVAGLGSAPTLLQTLATTGAMAAAVYSMDFGSSAETVGRRLKEVAYVVDHPFVILVILLVAVWQTWIWAAGLERARNLNRDSALFVAAIIALLGALSSIL